MYPYIRIYSVIRPRLQVERHDTLNGLRFFRAVTDKNVKCKRNNMLSWWFDSGKEISRAVITMLSTHHNTQHSA